MHSLADTSTHMLGLLHCPREKHKDGAESELDSHPRLAYHLAPTKLQRPGYELCLKTMVILLYFY